MLKKQDDPGEEIDYFMGLINEIEKKFIKGKIISDDKRNKAHEVDEAIH